MERPNRFIAYVTVDGRREKVHVKNTGRCRELLREGARVWLERAGSPGRSTLYDLVAVQKGSRLVNIDSQAPNKAAGEWLYTKELFPDLLFMRPETQFGNSRFDFYIETAKDKIFLEVKGVTLEEDGVVRFPDAPSERAVKHVEELIRAREAGYRVFVLFVIQMEGVKCFTPNKETHPEFAEALSRAQKAGVELLAYDCIVTPDSMVLNAPVRVCMEKEELENLPNLLLSWYDENKRALPWREEITPYRVWVSEIMLQQTRVEAVKPYYQRFMDALPDPEALAAAEEDALLKLWEGLGYYSRVRNMQKAALQIMEDYGGRMPDTKKELLKLKGIGSYTAGAIASIAYGERAPAVDGNVLRVLSRIRKDSRPISDAKVKTAVEEELQRVMPEDRPGDFNQAMMEIGATVCVPNGAPHCTKCPLEAICLAHRDKEEMEYPKKAPPKPRTIEEKTVLVIQDENRVVITKRPAKGLLAGMYEFPSLEGFCTAEEVVGYLAQNGLNALRVQPLKEAKHIFTHREWRMRGYMVRVDELEPRIPERKKEDWLLIEPGMTRDQYPMPSAFAAYTKYLSMKLGKEKYREE